MSLSFGAELRRAMAAQGISNVELARRVGVRTETISILRHDAMRPSHELAIRLADELVRDGLVTISLASRRGQCELCGAHFISQERGGNRRRFCGRACTLTAQRQRTKARVRESSAVARHRLTTHQEAVAAYCWDCEPEGLCRTAECRLRRVSPLPLAKERAT